MTGSEKPFHKEYAAHSAVPLNYRFSASFSSFNCFWTHSFTVLVQSHHSALLLLHMQQVADCMPLSQPQTAYRVSEELVNTVELLAAKEPREPVGTKTKTINVGRFTRWPEACPPNEKIISVSAGRVSSEPQPVVLHLSYISQTSWFFFLAFSALLQQSELKPSLNFEIKYDDRVGIKKKK